MARANASRSAAAAALLLAGCAPEPAPIAPHVLDAAALQPLLERLDRLTAALQANAAAPVPAAVLAGNTAPADSAHDATHQPAAERVVAHEVELSRRLAALEQAVVRLQAKGGAGPFPAPAEVVLPKQAHVVASLMAQLKGRDAAARAEARRSLFRLTEEQVVQRLGMPDSTYVDALGHPRWSYRDADRSFSLRFVNGRVAHFE